MLGALRLVESEVGLTDQCASYSLLRQDFQFVGVRSTAIDPRSLYPSGPLLLVYADEVSILVEQYQFFTTKDLRSLATSHGVAFTSRYRRSWLVNALRLHQGCHCPRVVMLFQRTTRRRQNVQILHLQAPLSISDLTVEDRARRAETQRVRTQLLDDDVERHGAEVAPAIHALQTERTFPEEKSSLDKYEIIREWQSRMAPSCFVETACAVCGWGITATEIRALFPSRPVLNLLRNDCLPSHVLPDSYDLEVYNRAILCPEGMTSVVALASLRTCSRCYNSLTATTPQQPKYALANFLYYGNDRLPVDVKEAFHTASPFDLMLIARSRSSVVTHHFVRHGSRGGYVAEECSQRFNRGNVAIFPQDPGPLRQILPPGGDDIRNTVCVLFSGGGSRPTLESLKRFGPVLVNKRKVETMIKFLVEQNEWYLASGVEISHENMGALFHPSDAELEVGVLQYMQVEHADEAEKATSYDGEWVDIPDILMDNHAYTLGDHSPRTRDSMKVHALAYALDRKRFLNSQAGTAYMSDSHPGLMSFLFPHLDPWGIGGFHHPGRAVSQRISFEAQVKCVLRQHCSRFLDDPNFAFVCWNMIQKQAVSRQFTFSTGCSSHRFVSRELTELAPVLTAVANKWARDPFAKAGSEKEKRVVSVLRKLHVASKNVSGSAGYKLCRRNEIRSLIRCFSTPALFITLNPHDLSSALLGALGGVDEDTWRGLSAYDRAVFVAKHPHAAARSFDAQIRAFLDIVQVVRFGKGSGLFGTCKAYYGTVEAQGRGTLHCHLMLWLEGNPSPQELRDRMVAHPPFRNTVFSWMEDMIKCELPGMTTPLDPQDTLLPTDFDEEGRDDPRLAKAPQIASMTDANFELEFRKFVRDLAIKCNWHTHTDTCFKHLRKGEPRSDGNCRMRINGQTRAITDLDEDTKSILLRRLHPWINNFNDVVLFLIQSNMDIKYIGSGPAAKALVYYITDYITKSDLKIHIGVQTLQAAMKSHADKFQGDTFSSEEYKDRNLVTKCANSLLGRQEISHQQVMSYFVGGGDFYTSHQYRTFRFYEFMKALKAYDAQGTEVVDAETFPPFDSQEQREQEVLLDVSSGEPTMSSEILDYTMCPVEHPFEEMSLWEFIERTRKVKKQPRSESDDSTDENEDEVHDNGFDDDTQAPVRGRPRTLECFFSCEQHPQFHTHWVKLRSEPVIPVILGDAVPRDKGTYEDNEAYCCYMMLLLHPWRSFADLRPHGDTWTGAFQRAEFSSYNSRIMANLAVDAECRDAKVDQTIDMASVLPMEGEDFLAEDTIFVDGDPLSLMLAEDDTLDAVGEDLLHCGVDEAEVGFSSRNLTEDEMDVSRITSLHCHPKENLLSDANLDGCCTRVEDVEQAEIQAFKRFMAEEKRKKRPRDIDEEDESSPRKRAMHFDPRIDIEKLLDGVRPEAIYPSSMSRQELLDVIEEIHDEFSLDINEEQSRAFRIAAEHFVFCSMDQMLLFITGIGGSGKSHVIKAIVALFKRCGCPENLLLSAPTGSAAVLIDGYTIHALTFLPGGNAIFKRSDLEMIWGKVRYLILDEVSMISAELLCQISERITIGKKADTAGQSKLFGGVNVIFAGDLGQLRPVGSSALFASDLLGRLSASTTESIKGHRGLFGAWIWQQLTHVVELKKNVRAAKDPQYISLLNRIREGRGTATCSSGPSDYQTLQQRTMDKLQLNSPDDYKLLQAAPVVFGERRLRDLHNELKAKQFAAETGQECHWYLAIDKIKKQAVRGEDRLRLSRVRTKESKEALGRLPLIPGMPVMVTENLAMGGKVVNGSEGVLTSVVYRNSEEGREAVCAYVKINSSPIAVEGLPEGVVPIFPVAVHFTYKSRGSKSVKVSRTQLPLVPGWAFTDYKVQGASMNAVIVDLASARGIQNAYVMLSRATSLRTLGVFRWFPPHRMFARLQEDLRNELLRIARLDAKTTEWFTSSHPTQ